RPPPPPLRGPPGPAVRGSSATSPNTASPPVPARERSSSSSVCSLAAYPGRSVAPLSPMRQGLRQELTEPTAAAAPPARGSAARSGPHDSQVDPHDTHGEEDDHEQHRREKHGDSGAASQRTTGHQQRHRRPEGDRVEEDPSQLVRRLGVAYPALDESGHENGQREDRADRSRETLRPPFE